MNAAESLWRIANQDIEVGDRLHLMRWPESTTFRVTAETAWSLVGVFAKSGIENAHEILCPRVDDWFIVLNDKEKQ